MTSVQTRTRMVSLRTGAVSALVAAVCYSSFLLSRLTGSATEVNRGFVSELESAGQPYAWLYRLSDVLAGVAIVMAAVTLRSELGRRRWITAGAGLLALVGVSSVLDGLTSMRCNPSVDVQCAVGEGSVSGLLGQLSASHTDTGLLGFLGAVAGAIVLGGALVERWPAWGWAHIGLGSAGGLCGLADLVVLLAHQDIGTIERARVLLTSAWFVVIALFLFQLSSSRAASTNQGRESTQRNTGASS